MKIELRHIEGLDDGNFYLYGYDEEDDRYNIDIGIKERIKEDREDGRMRLIIYRDTRFTTDMKDMTENECMEESCEEVTIDIDFQPPSTVKMRVWTHMGVIRDIDKFRKFILRWSELKR